MTDGWVGLWCGVVWFLRKIRPTQLWVELNWVVAIRPTQLWVELSWVVAIFFYIPSSYAKI